MNKLLVTILAIMFSTAILFGQSKKITLHKKKHIIHSVAWLDAHYKPSYDDCINTQKYSLAQLINKYPFNKAIKIWAVSYPVLRPPYTIWKILPDGGKELVEDTTQHKAGLKIKNDLLDHSTLIEIKELDKNQIAALTKLIYNIGYRKTSFPLHMETHGSCYDPRNAILFLDKHEKVIDYIEICFQCMESHSKNDDRLSIGTLCTQKYDLMKRWFIDAGISYGTIKTERDSI